MFFWVRCREGLKSSLLAPICTKHTRAGRAIDHGKTEYSEAQEVGARNARDSQDDAALSCSWHVWNEDNVERVKRDEQEALEKEKAEAARVLQAVCLIQLCIAHPRACRNKRPD